MDYNLGKKLKEVLKVVSFGVVASIGGILDGVIAMDDETSEERASSSFQSKSCSR